MTVIAGVDVGNATTEVVLVSGGKILGAGRVPTRGRKGSPGSLRAAAGILTTDPGFSLPPHRHQIPR